MDADWLASPPVALALFLALAGGLYWLSGRWAARSEDSPGKHQPYACGEDLRSARPALPGVVSDQDGPQLSYHGFFRLALMFVVVHMATLLLAILPNTQDMRFLATAYLIGIAICVDVLVREER